MHRPIILLLLLGALPSFAQDAASRISASFYAFAYVPGQESIHVPTGGGSTEVRLSTANIVGPVDCALTGGQLALHAAPLTGQAAGPAPIARCKVAAGITKAVVILFPAAAGAPEKYRSIVFNHDHTDFPLGIYRLVNLANKPIRGAVGREVVKAQPGGIADLKLEGEPGTVVPVRFEFFEAERWNLLTETRAAIRKDRRWLMFVFQDPATSRMNLRSIPDRTIPAATQAPATQAP